MKRLIWVALFIVILTATQALAFPIRNYTTIMEIQPDSSVIVTETIVADFTGEPRHGIYREIPFTVKDKYGSNYRVRHEELIITDENGNPLQTKITSWGGRLKIRIGDPNIQVQDVRTYVIHYKMLRAIHFFETYDELYWNPVGPEWEVPIEHASCIVSLPPGAKKDQIRAMSFTGIYGATTSEASSDIPDDRTVRFWMNRTLNPGESMTIVVGWQKGLVTKPKFSQEVLWFISDNGFCFLPPVFFLIVLGLWNWMGRDPETGRSEVVTYDPPDNMRPAEIGTLIDESADIRDIAATIIDLAVRGYIKITASTDKGIIFSKTDYLLELTRKYDETISDQNLSDFEHALIRALFSAGEQRWISSLKNNFYVHLQELQDRLYDELVLKGDFTHRPDEVRKGYQGVGFVIIGLAVFLGFFLKFSLGWSIAIGVCGVILALAARTMPRKTKKGKNALLGARGFEEYLSRAEKDEIVAQERQNYFEKFLPYAMAFGIATQWAKAFEGIQTKPPEWFEGYDGSFTPYLFAHHLSMASSSWGSTMASQPRSSGGSSFGGGGSGFGGGFSGGGGGGGGGGGW